MNLEEAIEWCVSNGARVSFGIDYYNYRVRIKIGGHPEIERNSFLEAVTYYSEYVTKRRKELGLIVVNEV